MVRRRSTVRFRKGAPEKKRRRTIRLQRYVLNPPMKAVTWLGLNPGHMLVETTGRLTGKRRRTVVGCQRDADRLWVVAEQGRHAGYVRNLEADPEVRVRLGRRWRQATAHVVDSDDPVARLQQFPASHGRVVQRVGTSLLSVRFDLW
jgi:deazaflavin-dependent oxidoreductase (nitroreductase family)